MWKAGTLSIKALSEQVTQSLINIGINKEKRIVLNRESVLYGCLEISAMISRAQLFFQSLLRCTQ